MDILALAPALVIGSLTGFLSGLLGVGGGFIMVPLLILAGTPTNTAIGNSLAYIIFTGTAGVLQHRRLNNCSTRLVLPIAASGMITAQLGAIATSFVETSILELLLALILIAAAWRMTRTPSQQQPPDPDNCTIKTPTSLLIGSAVGFLSGLIGVGGGFLLTPLMVNTLGIPIHLSIGSSLLAVSAFAVSGTIRHTLMGNIDPILAVALTAGGVTLAPLGATATKKCSPKLLRRLLSILLTALSAQLILSNTGLLK